MKEVGAARASRSGPRRLKSSWAPARRDIRGTFFPRQQTCAILMMLWGWIVLGCAPRDAGPRPLYRYPYAKAGPPPYGYRQPQWRGAPAATSGAYRPPASHSPWQGSSQRHTHSYTPRSLSPVGTTPPSAAVRVAPRGAVAPAPSRPPKKPVVALVPSTSPLRPKAPQAAAAGPNEAERPTSVAEKKIQATAFKQPLVSRDTTRAVVLMYHSIDRKPNKRSVHPQVFRNQLTYLRKSGVELIAMSQLIDFLIDIKRKLPARVAVVTIDDGEASFLRNALPHLLELRVPFTLGIISKVAASDSPVALNWKQLRSLLRTGLCEVASHGHTHVGLKRVTPVQRRYELAHSRNEIERQLKVRPRAFLYPLGSVDNNVARLAEAAGYEAAFSAVGKTVMHDVWRYRIPRFDVGAGTPLALLTKWFLAPKAPSSPGKSRVSP